MSHIKIFTSLRPPLKNAAQINHPWCWVTRKLEEGVNVFKAHTLLRDYRRQLLSDETA